MDTRQTINKAHVEFYKKLFTKVGIYAGLGLGRRQKNARNHSLRELIDFAEDNYQILTNPTERWSVSRMRIFNVMRCPNLVLAVILLVLSGLLGFAGSSFNSLRWSTISMCLGIMSGCLQVVGIITKGSSIQVIGLVMTNAILTLFAQLSTNPSTTSFPTTPRFAISGWIAFATFLSQALILEILKRRIDLTRIQKRLIARNIILTILTGSNQHALAEADEGNIW